MRRMRVCTDTGIRECHTFTLLDHRRHFFQVDLVHDAVTRRNHIDIFKCCFGPFNKMETVFVTTVFNSTVFSEGIRVKTAVFHR
ncbi:hypothetical protein SDC9_210001 [bioreactor metagenome]|uniref:Uncharacterized protein n=1 Tax=bioreactor metagenome TaxID=1076179 RepID=A0A645JPQ5_9ZZZZ